NQDSYELANRYNYVNGDPVNYSDPTGHFAMPNWLNYTLGGIGVAVSGIATVATMGIATPATTALGVASTTLFAGGLGTQIAADNVTDENAKQILNYTSLGLNAAGIVTGIGYANGASNAMKLIHIKEGANSNIYKQGAYVFKVLKNPSQYRNGFTIEREARYSNRVNEALGNSYRAETFYHPKLGRLTMKTPYIKFKPAEELEIDMVTRELGGGRYHILNAYKPGTIVKDTSGQFVVLDPRLVVDDKSPSVISNAFEYSLAQDRVRGSTVRAVGAHVSRLRKDIVARREIARYEIGKSAPLSNNDAYHNFNQEGNTLFYWLK
ncbi:MAG: hypothetical protein PHC75_06890, partial [Burkholderiales bacterium]|nr:hypothetical protein [Burkholderiales bacterium]